MASGFFVLLDDIAVLMDDVAAMSKVATQKTAGLLADDLAVNAEKASGFASARELPVLWKITKGSIINKIIILPVTFLLSAFLPQAIVPILIIGGIYLSYEGALKIFEYFFKRGDKKKQIRSKEMTKEQLLEHENKKVKSAILVDFILSIEIIFIALGTVIEEEFIMQIIVVTFIALLATVFVYGLVALLVRMDDFGYKLIAHNIETDSFSDKVGIGLVKTLPYIIRSLGVIGTIAMILVGGGIFVHNIHFFHDIVHSLPKILGEFLVGLVVGLIAYAIIKPLKKTFKKA
jgi:predicted DNA repair protein MutK